jgi:metal-responsive CopG/Arc/MetJ family transcriptional regulator
MRHDSTGMTAIKLEIPNDLYKRLNALSQRRGQRVFLIREGIRLILSQEEKRLKRERGSADVIDSAADEQPSSLTHQ